MPQAPEGAEESEESQDLRSKVKNLLTRALELATTYQEILTLAKSFRRARVADPAYTGPTNLSADKTCFFPDKNIKTRLFFVSFLPNMDLAFYEDLYGFINVLCGFVRIYQRFRRKMLIV